MASYLETLAEARERELDAEAASVFEATMAALEGAPNPIDPRRVIETANDKGERVFLVMPEPEPLRISMPMRMEFPRPDPLDFVIGRQLGGFVRQEPRIVHVITLPCPTAPAELEIRL